MSLDLAEPSVALSIVGAGFMLLLGMITGVWKFVEMLRSPEARAPRYVNIAHRAALMYAYAMGVIVLLAALSNLPQIVEIIAVLVDFLFFFIATGTYIIHGVKRTAKTQYLERNFTTGLGTWILAAAEVGATAVLVAGAVCAMVTLW